MLSAIFATDIQIRLMPLSDTRYEVVQNCFVPFQANYKDHVKCMESK